MTTDPFAFTPSRPRPSREEFDQLEATELYCPKCGRAVPVRKSLLLVLPEEDRYEYRCRFCGTEVGEKIDRSGQFYEILRK